MGEWLAREYRAAYARAWVRISASFREPSWVLSEVFLPLFAMYAYLFVYRALGAPREYETFAVVGGLLLAYWLSVLWSMAAQFYWEKQMGNLEFYMIAPCSRFSVLIGMAVGGIFWTTSRAVVGVALGVWLLRVPLDFGQLPEALGVLALTLVSMYALGMWMASLFLLYGREVWHLANAFQEPVYLASGLYFPVRALGPWVAVSFAVLPLTLGLDALRQVLAPKVANGLLPLGLELLLLVVSGVFFLVIAALSWRWLEHRSKVTGRLILRFQ